MTATHRAYEVSTPKELKRKLEQGAPICVLDVRTPAEFREVHVEEATNLPLDSLSREKVEELSTGNPVYLLCRTGRRAIEAAESLNRDGLSELHVVEGGTEACIDEAFDVSRGKKAVSLERQVRIAAGGLSFAGALLALFVHPYFAAVPAFVGAGLVYAGVTDTCAMGMLLAKMPWNNLRDSVA